MSIQRNGKIYYTQEEMDKRMYDYIRETGKEMIEELQERRKQDDKKAEYV